MKVCTTKERDTGSQSQANRKQRDAATVILCGYLPTISLTF